MRFLFLYCRPGFENECAAEIQDLAAEFNVFGYSKAKPSSSYVTFHPQNSDACDLLIAKLSFARLIFTRQWFAAFDLLSTLPIDNRVTPLMETILPHLEKVDDIFYEHLDTNDGKALSGLCKSFAKPFNNAVAKANILTSSDNSGFRLHVCFLSSNAAAIGYSKIYNSSPWPMGIPRLRLPKSAPSRSTLKLDEAILTFFSRDAVSEYFQSGMQAVDLGAAPGGWTWQLVKYGIRVAAIDNGPMDQALLDSGLVTHKQEDAFRYKPSKPVEWMVCDIVDKPARVAHLIIQWLENRWCKNSIFNLKLPMKKRYQEVMQLLNKISNALSEKNLRFELHCKQLYHDREEVTVFISLIANQPTSN